VGFRFTSADALPNAGETAAVKSILDASAPIRFNDWSVEGAEWVAQGSPVSVPVAPPVVIAGTSALPAQQLAARAQYIGWTGRSFGGSRAGIFLFGINIQGSQTTQTNDYRLTVAENTTVAAVRTALVNAASAGLCAIDGGAIAWKLYANLGYNSYQQRKARGS
jgi:hypothetical protein